MDDLDPFERQLAAALRADADDSLRRPDPVAIVRAAVAGHRQPAVRIPVPIPIARVAWRFVAAAVVVVLAVGGAIYLARPGQPTVGGPSTPPAEASATPLSTTPVPVAGGCGSTQVFAGPGPDANLGLADNPWTAATPADTGIVAYFWYPPPDVLFATDPAGNSPKVLWINHAHTGQLSVTAHPLGARTPVVRFAFGAAASPPDNYPSLIALPSPGCWHFDLAIGATRATMDLMVTSARPPSATCAGRVWPATTISCDAAYRIGDQAGARVDRARIWLTTLGAVKASMHPLQQATEPAETAEVWAIVYDGFWRCCANAVDASGNSMPLVDQASWLVVAEAARPGTGFVYLQDWTGRPVPYLLAPPGP
jgi:hypothetical protein